jgi:hypothetical protein
MEGEVIHEIQTFSKKPNVKKINANISIDEKVLILYNLLLNYLV